MEEAAGCANPQLLGWVKEWLDVARERNSKGVTAYKNAYDSLKACPITFQHPSELQKLKGFGPKLCERLQDKLKKHCQENGLPMPEHPQARRTALAEANSNADGAPKPKKPRKTKEYVPAFRSGPYALIVGLSTQPEQSSTGMTKTDLIEIAQPHCDSSFSVPSDPTKFYTAWNSMKTLVQKEMVFERGRPLRRYALTDEGWDVAKRIKGTVLWQTENKENEPQELNQDIHPSHFLEPAGRDRSSSPEVGLRQTQAHYDAGDGSGYQGVVADGSSTDDGSLPDYAPILLPPGSFTVHLLLDVREVRTKTDRDYMQEELAKHGVKPIMRSLEVGDAQWIAKIHDPGLLARQGAEGDEIVLDWIAERKRLDDLIGSIKDGRFHEQKFRLRKSGVKKVIYIIEEIAMDSATYQRYEEAVQSAIASTQVVNGYFVKRTPGMDDTIKYLARMTSILKQSYEKTPLCVIPTKVLTAANYLPLLNHLQQKHPATHHYITYAAFASLASKSETMTLRDVYLKMLMTLRGITGERALEIQKKWRTPYDLVLAFKDCRTGESGKKRKYDLVANETSYLVGRKKISKALSQKVAEVWGDV